MIDDSALARLRGDTPSCGTLLHFNNAGASLMPDPVHKAVADHLDLEVALGGYEAAAAANAELDGFYSSFARLLGAGAEEMAYVENATRAWDMAFYSLPLKEGDRILTHTSEYASNYLAFLQQAKRRGLEIDVAPSDDTGQIDIQRLPDQIGPRTKLIAITHVPTQGGLINPAEAVGKVARDHGILFMLDACQSVGQINVNVKDIGCQILSGTGRKFLRGPRGTGFLYVSNDIVDDLDPPFIDLHAATWTGPDQYKIAAGAKRFENWECFFAGKIGLARAVDYALEIGMPAIEERVVTLAATLREKLLAVPGVSVHDQGARKSGIVTFAKPDEAPDAIAARLRAQKINISTSTILAAQLDFGARGLGEVCRASVHYFNTDDEIDRFCQTLGKA